MSTASLFIVVCIAALVSIGQAQTPPQIPGKLPLPPSGTVIPELPLPPPGTTIPGLTSLRPGTEPEIEKCLSAITSVPGCAMEVYVTLLSGKLGLIGPACCNTLNKLKDNCWPKVFPIPFPPVLRNACPEPNGLRISSSASKAALPGLFPPRIDYKVAQCFTPLMNVEGCDSDVYRLAATGQVGAIDAACCEAIWSAPESCWLPNFYSLLKSSCGASSPASI